LPICPAIYPLQGHFQRNGTESPASIFFDPINILSIQALLREEAAFTGLTVLQGTSAVHFPQISVRPSLLQPLASGSISFPFFINSKDFVRRQGR